MILSVTTVLRRIACSLLILAAACAEEEDSYGTGRMPQTRTDMISSQGRAARVIGLEIVDAPDSLLEDLRVGDARGDSDAIFFWIVGLLVDAAGTMYVLEQADQEVRVFDSTGHPVHRFGRRGGGPGELRRATGLAWGPDSTILIADPGNGRYASFSREGTFLGSFRQEFTHFRPEMSLGADESGALYDEYRRAGHPFAVRRRDLATDSSEQSFLTDSIHAQGYPVPGGYYALPFGWRFVWRVDRSGSIWSARTDRYAILKRSFLGDTLLLIEADLPSLPVTDAERHAAIRRLEGRFGSQLKLDYSRIPDRHPLIENVDIDDAGQVWVRRVTRDRRFWADVFSPEGTFLRAVAGPWRTSPWYPLVVVRDRVYTVLQDSLGVSFVVRGRIRPGAQPSAH